MSHSPENRYTFSDGIPIAPIDPGSTVFVAGPALSGATDLATTMVADGCLTGDGTLFISTNTTSERLLDGCQQSHPQFDETRAGIIDCCGQDAGRSASGAQVKHISTQSDLTGIGMKFSALYESLYMESGGPVRAGLVTLSSLSMFNDLRKLFQFIQTLSARIESAGGLAVFAVDPTTHDTKTINTLTQVADGRIDVRDSDDGDGELESHGLSGQSEGWQSFRLPESETQR